MKREYLRGDKDIAELQLTFEVCDASISDVVQNIITKGRCLEIRRWGHKRFH